VVVVILLAVVIGGLLVCGGAYFWGRSRSRIGGDFRRARCLNNLKQIGLAMHNYHDVYKCFPPAYISDENGKPMHSWRVLLLPFMEQEMLYKEYNFDEPWDGPTNLALTNMIPQVYRCPEDTNGRDGETSYLMIVGPGTFSTVTGPRRLGEFPDGAVSTIMLAETVNSGVNWVEPRDFEVERMRFEINDPAGGGIGSRHPGGVNAAMCDGSVRWLSEWTTAEDVRAMTTINGGEVIGRD